MYIMRPHVRWTHALADDGFMICWYAAGWRRFIGLGYAAAIACILATLIDQQPAAPALKFDSHAACLACPRHDWQCGGGCSVE